jgi:hypothetical protein
VAKAISDADTSKCKDEASWVTDPGESVDNEFADF